MLDGGDALGADGALLEGSLAAGGATVESAGAAELSGALIVSLCFLPCLLLAGAVCASGDDCATATVGRIRALAARTARNFARSSPVCSLL